MLEVIIACEGQTEREFCRSVLKPYLASKGNAATLVRFFRAWLDEHKRKLSTWKTEIANEPYGARVTSMIEERLNSKREKLAEMSQTKADVERQASNAKDNSSPAEVAFWQSVSETRDPAQYEAYLTAFPQGLFAGLARAKIAGLSGSAAQPASADVPKIATPLMLHYASLDERINAGIADYETALKAVGKSYEIHMYEGANHAFNNDTNAARYNKQAADLAWGRTVAFLKKHAG